MQNFSKNLIYNDSFINELGNHLEFYSEKDVEISIEKYGSLEVGKSATLVISKGDALDMMTNNIICAYIDGRSLELINRQIELYNKYKKKYVN